MDAPGSPKSTIKCLCSYSGTIFPRYPDGKLRYCGGHNRVLAIDRAVGEAWRALWQCCEPRCQMPTEDLDALVSTTSDEDLANVMEEYERVDSPLPSWLKIRAFLSPPKSLRRVSKDSLSLLSRSYSFSSAWSSSSSSSRRSATAGSSKFGSWPRNSMVPPSVNRLVHQVSPPTADPIGMEEYAGRNSSKVEWVQIQAENKKLNYWT